MKSIRQRYKESTFVAKIRYSYLLLLAPVFLFLVIFVIRFWSASRQYQDTIQSVLVASRFNLDFKKDFDYETYLLIVGNKTKEESRMGELLAEAETVVDDLESMTTDRESIDRLESVKKYIKNLKHYQNKIEENLDREDRYEENMLIWENDVQIVTTLLREEFVAYNYEAAQKLQESQSEYRAFTQKMLTGLIFTMIVLTGIIFWMSYYIPRTITRPIKQLSEVTDLVAKGDLDVRSHVEGGPEVRMLSDSMNAMIDRINALLLQVTHEQTQLRKAEFLLLQSQINPHFLYNTLDAIIWLAEAGEHKKVVSMVGSLSSFFRASLNQGRDIVSLEDELSHVRSYLEIQQVRYQDILTYEIDIPRELYSYRIPKITIQPLVENALYHGIKNRRGGGMIRIVGRKEPDYLVIEVSDEGPGMNPERLEQVRRAIRERSGEESGSYGLYNVNERIRLHFGEDCGIFLESTVGVGTTVSVRLTYETEYAPASD